MKDLVGRFEKKIDKTKGCWNWIGAKHRQGYGNFGVKGKIKLSHRVSWEIYVGKIPKDMCVCHKCDNPSCVNPDHLFLGSQYENVQDCKKKGRLLKNSKKSWENSSYNNYKCKQCKKKFKSRSRNKPMYCSRSCKSKWTWKNVTKHRGIK